LSARALIGRSRVQGWVLEPDRSVVARGARVPTSRKIMARAGKRDERAVGVLADRARAPFTPRERHKPQALFGAWSKQDLINLTPFTAAESCQREEKLSPFHEARDGGASVKEMEVWYDEWCSVAMTTWTQAGATQMAMHLPPTMHFGRPVRWGDIITNLGKWA
jgi:hypothetical protein